MFVTRECRGTAFHEEIKAPRNDSTNDTYSQANSVLQWQVGIFSFDPSAVEELLGPLGPSVAGGYNDAYS